MRGGQLHDLVAIEQKVVTPDPLGGQKEVWQKVDDEWADILYPSGIESIKGDAIISTVRASIQMRWRNDVDATMRISFEGDIFNIRAVLRDRRHRDRMNLVCEMGADNG